MFHIWRKIYWLVGWDYPKDLMWIEQQRWNKHLLTEDIKKRGVNIIFVLKPKLIKHRKIENTITRKNKKHRKRNNL